MDITMMPIGTVHTPFGTTGEIPKGLDAKHDADGVIEIAPAFEPGCRTSRDSRTSTSCGTSTTSADMTSSRIRRATIGRTASLRRARLCVPAQLA